MFDLKKRVAKGAQLLDQKRPGWYREIDTSNLNMAERGDCILGQLYPYYSNGTSELFGHSMYTMAEWREEKDHGFDLGGGWDRIHTYGALKRAWIKEIKARYIRSNAS